MNITDVLDIKQIVSGVITALIVIVIKIITQKKSALRWGVLRDHSYIVNRSEENPRGNIVRTRAVLFKNEGGRKTGVIEVLLNHPVEHFAFWPPIDHKISELPDGRIMIKFESISSKSYLFLDFFSVNLQIPNILNVKNDGNIVTPVNYKFYIDKGFVFNYFIYVLLFFGFTVLVYFSVIFVLFLCRIIF